MTWAELLATIPLVAILRGLTPEEAEPVGAALVEGRLPLPRGAAQLAAAVGEHRDPAEALR